MRHIKIKAALLSVAVIAVAVLSGCGLFDGIFPPRTINGFIRMTDQKPEEITELICDPGADQGISGRQYDMLEKCTSLESITLIGITDQDLAQEIFARRAGDIKNYGHNGVGPVWCLPMDEIYSDDNRPSPEELEDMKKRLLTELEKLI